MDQFIYLFFVKEKVELNQSIKTIDVVAIYKSEKNIDNQIFELYESILIQSRYSKQALLDHISDRLDIIFEKCIKEIIKLIARCNKIKEFSCI